MTLEHLPGLGATVLVSRTYKEARELLVDARDYLVAALAEEELGLAPNQRLALTLESSRLTARLINMMAWLMLQRAAQAGEISMMEAVTECPDLGARAACLAQSAPEGLPEDMTELLDRSHKLYIRLARLDEMARQRVA